MEPFILEDGSKLYILAEGSSVMYIRDYPDGVSVSVVEVVDG